MAVDRQRRNEGGGWGGCNCFPARGSSVPVPSSLPMEPTSTRSQTREGGLNQTFEPQNMTWQVQQEKKGGGESWCELIELHPAKNTMCGAESGQTDRLRFIMTVYTHRECCYDCCFYTDATLLPLQYRYQSKLHLCECVLNGAF